MGSGSSKPSTTSASLSTYPDFISSAIPGKAKALVMGCNYTGADKKLQGCIADSNRVVALLTSWGFICTQMTDLSPGDLNVTKANILAKLDQFLSNLAADETLIIYFSGHGALEDDLNTDENGGSDSVIVPIDYTTAGTIKDDEIRTKLLKAKQGKVFCFFDSCNSGSVCDLRFNILSSTYRSILSTKRFYDPKEWNSVSKIFENTKYESTDTQILSLSGSRDSQVSWEIYDSVTKSYGGAMTFAAIQILRQNTPRIKVTEFTAKVIALLNTWGYGSQTPQLMAGQTFDQNTLFSDYIGV